MIEVACSKCGKKYRVDEEKIKKDTAKFKCKQCGETVVVRKRNAAPEPQAAPPPPPPSESPAVSPPPSIHEETVRVEDVSSIAERPKIRFGLASKIITLMLVVSLVPLGVFWGISFVDTNERVRENTEILLDQIAEGLGAQLDEWFDKNVKILKTAARLPDIQSMDQRKQEPILKAISSEYPWIYLAFTVDPDGMNRARDDGKPLKDYSDRLYYTGVIQEGKDLAWQTLIGRTSGKPAIVMSVPIRSGDRTVGVMAAGMNIDSISERVAAWKKGRSGFAFLVDEQGKVLSHQIAQYVKTQKNLKDHPLVKAYWKKKKPTTMSFTNQKGNEALGHVRGNAFGWALVVQQEHKEVFQTLKDIQRFAIILLGITVVCVTLLAWFLARRVTRPIKKLTNAAEQMSLGDLNVEIDVTSKDEIGHLAQALGRMQTSLRLAIGRLRKRST
ncbi:MAG: cache domain-containing protein [Desulfobacteraceae bacterium]|jgi:methyl-accepting chemotaxis protein